MIIEKIKITNNKRKNLTRICDNCSKKEVVRMDSVWRSRRKKDMDLCFKCSNLFTYKKNKAWDSGEKSHNWKGGRIKTRAGFFKVYQKSRRYKYEHRIVAEKK